MFCPEAFTGIIPPLPSWLCTKPQYGQNSSINLFSFYPISMSLITNPLEMKIPLCSPALARRGKERYHTSHLAIFPHSLTYLSYQSTYFLLIPLSFPHFLTGVHEGTVFHRGGVGSVGGVCVVVWSGESVERRPCKGFMKEKIQEEEEKMVIGKWGKSVSFVHSIFSLSLTSWGSCFLFIHTLAWVAVSTSYPSYRTIYHHHHHHHILEKLYASGGGDFGLYIYLFTLYLFISPQFLLLSFFSSFFFFGLRSIRRG